MIKKTYQSAIYIDHKGEVLKTYRKRVPSSVEKGFTKGGGIDWKPFKTPYGACFMQVCKDMDGDGYTKSMPAKIDYFIGINADPDRGYQKVVSENKKDGCHGALCFQPAIAVGSDGGVHSVPSRPEHHGTHLAGDGVG